MTASWPRWFKWPSTPVAHALDKPTGWTAICGAFVPSAAVESLPHDGHCARCDELIREREAS